MPLRVAFYTLGCKLNQLETDSFADAFARAGAIVLPLGAAAPPEADLVVVNTCTVTGKAEQKARRMIRVALAADPERVAIITGCYAQVEAEALAALDRRAFVLPGAGKQLLLDLPSWLADRGSGGDLLGELREWLASVAPAIRDAASSGAGRFAFKPEGLAFHSRPALKVQDGCDNACAYCRVRIARGRAASLPATEVLARARALEEAGRAEIVLTGVNLSQYLDGETDFPALLRLLLAGTERIAFRLSSYEPDRIDGAFLEAFAHPRLRPHLHLAVQSGADPVLAGMGRRYRRSDVLAAVEALRRVRRDPFIAADLIAGFPCETESDAAATLELARDCEFAWIHVFRFSPRPGTEAWAMPCRVPERLTRTRVEAIRELGKAGKSAYIDRWRGAELGAVLEVGLGATTENYLKLKVKGLPESARRGQAIICKIDQDRSAVPLADADAFALYIGSEFRLNP